MSNILFKNIVEDLHYNMTTPTPCNANLFPGFLPIPIRHLVPGERAHLLNYFFISWMGQVVASTRRRIRK